MTPLITPVDIGGLTLRNRVAVAPMTRVSATVGGCPTQRMARDYASFADCGAMMRNS